MAKLTLETATGSMTEELTADYDCYADGSFLLALTQARTLHTMTRIPGEDGVLADTVNLDDRIAVIGGANSYYPTYGEEPVSISCEIMVPPGANPPSP